MKFLSLALIAFFCSVALQAQTLYPKPGQAKMACYNYRFMPGDSLVYRLVSHDSIYFKEKEPLMKKRMEKIVVVCDSVGRNGLYYLRQTLKDYIAQESLGDIKDVVREQSPWIGRTARIVLDSLGQRLMDSVEAPARSALSPGGAFQPNLLIGLYDSCSSTLKTWMVDRVTELLPENAYPAPIRVQTTLYEAYPEIDTLGFPSLRFQYTITGQGSMTAMDQKPPMRITSIIAGGGDMILSSEHHVPVHLQTGAQIKLEITTADGKLVKGTQYTHSTYTLEEFYRNGQTITDNAPADGAGRKKAGKRSKK